MTTGAMILMDGNPFSIHWTTRNTSNSGEKIVAIHIDLGPTGCVFDPVSGGVPNASFGLPFTPVTPGVTGFTSPAVVADGATVLDMTFTNFDPGDFAAGINAETFNFSIDVDKGAIDTVTGNQMAGAIVWVDFHTGERLYGTLTAVGASNPDAAQFTPQGRLNLNAPPAPFPTPIPRTPMPSTIDPRAIRARGPSANPVSLRYSSNTLSLWDHTLGAFVDLDSPPEGVRVWVELPFEQLPAKAQEYVRVLSRIALNREQGASPTYMAQLRDEAARLLRELQHEHTSTMRNNVANRPSLQRKLLDVKTGGLYYRSRVPIR